MTYIKQLEDQNEELQKKLAAALKENDELKKKVIETKIGDLTYNGWTLTGLYNSQPLKEGDFTRKILVKITRPGLWGSQVVKEYIFFKKELYVFYIDTNPVTNNEEKDTVRALIMKAIAVNKIKLYDKDNDYMRVTDE